MSSDYSTSNGMGTMEGRHLAESITLLRQEVREMRAEFRGSFEQRVTHSEINGFYKLMEEKVAHILQRINELEKEHENLEREHENDRKERDNERNTERTQRRAATYTAIGSVVVVVITTLGRPLLDLL